MKTELREKFVNILEELADSIEKKEGSHCNEFYNSVIHMLNNNYSNRDLAHILESLSMGEDFVFNNKNMFYDDFIDYLTTKSKVEQEEILVIIRSYWSQFFDWKVNNYYCLVTLGTKDTNDE